MMINLRIIGIYPARGFQDVGEVANKYPKKKGTQDTALRNSRCCWSVPSRATTFVPDWLFPVHQVRKKPPDRTIVNAYFFAIYPSGAYARCSRTPKRAIWIPWPFLKQDWNGPSKLFASTNSLRYVRAHLSSILDTSDSEAIGRVSEGESGVKV